MKFKNKPNDCIKFDGKEYWISRSIAIVSVLIFKEDKEYFVLLEKRSDKMEQPGRWCCPCGYLDWDENGWECMMREVYEETGLYIPDYTDKIIFNNNEDPFYINTKPDSERQNVALGYGVVFDSKFTFEKTKISDEITETLYVNVKDIQNYDLAFNHKKRIELFLKIIENK